MTSRADQIAAELSLDARRVDAVLQLLGEGATMPFIARYRKEKTGSLDEVAISSIRDRDKQLAALAERKEAIIASLAERDLLTPDLQAAVDAAATMTALEDLYLPYRPKRRTRAMIARERGLEPLADLIVAQDPATDPRREAEAYVRLDAGVESVDDALQGARDILAETINEAAQARGEIRELFEKRGTISSAVMEGKEVEGATYRDYFTWQEPLADAPSHRVLALLRAEREGIIRLSVRPEEEAALGYLKRYFVRGGGPCAEQVALAVEDGYKRLMAPSIETEIRAVVKEKADREAVRVFADNVRQLLLAPPLGQKRVLAIDPGFRTGGKVVCLDAQGKLLTHDVVYATGSESQRAAAKRTLIDLVTAHAMEAIAIGNGTASRETEEFVRSIDFGRAIPTVLVNESGASVYSASEVARAELPDQDVTVRGAVSIGRRLVDPLAELVKIDPKAIGVGQYQHDVDQGMLRQGLDDVVEHCVNAVGVEVNTASAPLLARVSGLGPKLAENIVSYRDENGPFRRRADLKKVPRLGPRAFEQGAGFLRIRDGDDPLDQSAVHPESYSIVRRMAADLGCTVVDLIRDAGLRGKIDLDRYVTDAVGLPTLNDILAELARPGRDPRERFETFAFSDDVHEIADLVPGMKLPGIVTNVVDFGAFVDIGVHQDGLIHVSQLADRFVEHPSAVVKVGQRVLVTVLEVDIERRRISLSLRTPRASGPGTSDSRTVSSQAADSGTRTRKAQGR
ncbi:MAG: Tex family protein [Candidatus Bipolaricaulota bacterium]|nr:Tex family protein [Candidatus Bipolaricaulota bacterium]